MRHFIVAGHVAAQQLMKVKYFKLDLGIKGVKNEKGKGPKYNFTNDFLQEYYSQHKRLPHLSGYIGSIELYVDYGLPAKKINVQLENKKEEFDFNHDRLLQLGSIEKYLGDILLKVDGSESVKIAPEKGDLVGSGYDNVINNPGAVSWDELVAYKRRNFKN